MKNLISFSLLSLTFLYANSDAINYLNSLRQEAGVVTLSEQNNLSDSAYNHSYYMYVNNVAGHIEQEGDEGFTGVYPSDRALAAGYSSKIVSENVSWGAQYYQYSIDSLMSAIYHRFTFLSLDKDEIGTGSVGSFYTYNLGNSYLNALCEGNGSDNVNGSYYLLCKDSDKKVSLEDYNYAVSSLKSQANKVVVWPPKNAKSIPPVFFEEFPDPLPYYSVSGYPVSVEFNSYFYQTPPTVNSMELKDAQGNIVDIITLMDKDNDPNGKLNAYQYALFPSQRLEWGSTYYVTLNYNDESGEKEEQWCFATRALATDRFYRVENNQEVTLKVVANKSYSIYVVPNSGDDELGQLLYDSRIQLNLIDKNTIVVRTSEAVGSTLKISADNEQIIYLEVAESDDAIAPKHEVCLEQSSGSSTQTTTQTTIEVENLTIKSNEGVQKEDENLYSLSDEIRVEIHKSDDIITIYKNNETLFDNLPIEQTVVEKKETIVEIQTNLPNEWVY